MDQWRVEADARIKRHRMADCALQLLDEAGQPLANRQVSVRSLATTLQLGTCVSAGTLLRQDDDGQRYRAFLRGHCTTLVDENDAKWYSTEKEAGQIDWTRADAIADFAAEHDLDLRGHCLFWDREKWVHDWVKELSDNELREAVLRRCEDAVVHMQGRVSCWDVFNEMLDGGYFEQRCPGITAEVFQLAAELDPDAALFINEFGILGGKEKCDRYIDLAHRLLDQGLPLGGLGIQEHACERFGPAYRHAEVERPQEIERLHNVQLEPEHFWQDCDRMALLGLPIHLTEVSCKMPDQEVRATGLEVLLRCAMAHPSIDTVMLWGFWERCHWLGDQAALVDKNWKLTLAGQRVLDLFENEWVTSCQLTSDEAGWIHWHGFKGRYAVQVEGLPEARIDLAAGGSTQLPVLAGLPDPQ